MITLTARNDAASVNEYATVSGNVIAGDGHGGVADTGFGPTVEVTDVVGGAVGAQRLSAAMGPSRSTRTGATAYVADHAEPLAVDAVVEDVFTYTASGRNRQRHGDPDRQQCHRRGDRNFGCKSPTRE
ncbi:MAG: hypothetical protein R3D30_00380 [Hyphomicrobiales bacterium]